MDLFLEQKDLEGLDFESLQNLTNKREEWLQNRKGKFTASEFHRLMGYDDKEELPKGAITYVIEKVLEEATTGEKKGFSTDSTEWGNETEKEAAEKFAEKYSLEISKYGDNQELIKLTKDVSCTPDGLTSDDAGFETKCPDSKTHLFYLENLTENNFKQLCTDYYWQVQGGMYITGFKKWYFISYDPRFKNESKRLLVLEIKRNDEDIEKLQKRLQQAIKLKREKLKQLM